LQRFAGPAVHSAAWPHDLDVSGKSVAIVGTGASCMQIAPEIADSVRRLTILQRTPLVWSHPGMQPYYRDAFGRIRTVLPWRMVDYFRMTRRPDFTDFEIRYATPVEDEAASA
jgi:cation diffusion facilitator CzcD-associated flavoprotein CzcO